MTTKPTSQPLEPTMKAYNLIEGSEKVGVGLVLTERQALQLILRDKETQKQVVREIQALFNKESKSLHELLKKHNLSFAEDRPKSRREPPVNHRSG